MPGISKYERDLRRQVRNTDAWPQFSKPKFLNRLDRLAGSPVQRRKPEGNLGVILIHHQLVEEMLRVLIADGQFFVKLAIFPTEIVFRSQSKQTFGQLLQAVRELVEFPHKAALLRQSAALNSLRIDVVHRLAARGSLGGLRTLEAIS